MAEANYWQRLAASHSSRRRALQAGAAGLSAAFLAACGGNTNNNNATQSNTSGANNANTTNSAGKPAGTPVPSTGGASPLAGSPAAKNGPKPQPGGELVIRRGSNFTFGNPIRASSGYDVGFNRLYAAPLLDYDLQGNVLPFLAQAFEQTDPTTITLKLRPGLNFTDGTPVNAAAIKYSIALAQTPELASPVRTQLAPIASIETPDDNTVVFKLSQPNATFVQTLATDSPGGAGAVVSPTAHDKLGEDKFNDAPVSVGPYAVQSYVNGSQMVLVKNPNWPLKAPNGDAQPYLDKLTIKVIPEAAVALADLQSGGSDIDQQPSLQNIAAIKAQPSIDYQVQKNSQLVDLAYIINKPPTDNLALRKAITYAMDRDAFAKAFTAGLGDPAKTAITQFSWAYDASIPSYSYDAAKAAQFLAQAGVGDNLSLKLLTYADGDWPKIGELVQSQLAKLKLNVGVDNVQVPVYTQQFRVNAAYPFAVEGLGAPAGDPYNFFQSRYTSNGNYNAGHPSEPEFDRLVAQAAVTFEQDKRKALYSQMQQMDYDMAYHTWLYYLPTLITFRKQVQGLGWAGVGVADFLYLWKSK
jgi:peptide/nickel transport system substrate-binding protein